jgi:two-component system, response regulator PdtaR
VSDLSSEMAVQTGDIHVPLHGPRSLLPDWRPMLFSAGDDTGSQKQPARPDRVLVIEDDLLIASQIESALTEAGFEIVGVVTSGEEALEVAGTRPLDLAVVDIRLAGDRDGVDTALELFRAHGIRCIFASAHSDSEAHRRADPAAPLGWLEKPYAMGSLTMLVRRAANELRSKRR